MWIRTLAYLKFITARGVNFGPFVDPFEFKLDRGPGLWYISGNNLVEPQLGANAVGKTSILNLIFWVITGRTMKSKRPGGRVEARKGKGTTEGELICERRGKSLNIKRTRKPNSLTLNDTPITDADLLNEFGIKPEVLQYTCMFGQSNPMFLSLGKEEQAALFNDLLDLDLWLQVAEKARKAGSLAEESAASCQKLIDELNGSIKSFREARKVAREQADIFERETKEKIEKLYDQQKAAEKEFTATSKELEKLGKPGKTTTLEADIEELSKKIIDTKTSGVQIAELLSGATSKLKIARTRLEDVKEARCDACGQVLPPATQKVTLEKTREDIASYKKDIDRYTKTLAVHKENLEVFENKRDILRRRLLDIKTSNENGRRDTLQRRHTQLEAELKNIDKDITYLSRTKNPHDSSDRILLTRIKTAKTELEEAAKTLDSAEKLVSLSKLWQTSAKEIRLSIIDEALEETAAMATKHAERLGLQGWRIDLATERQNSAGNTTLGFTASLYPPDEIEPVAWETYSGGEETRLQLAMSYGLSDVLLTRAGIPLNIEILDEPSRGLAAEGISDLLECLVDRARETGKSIYLIDHHSLGAANFSGTLLVEKSKTGSHIIEV